MSLFRASVSARGIRPVITLSGGTHMSTVVELDELVMGQLAERIQHSSVDVAALDFADTAAIQVFLLAAKRPRQHGGDLVLLHPQPALARVLEITGADEALTIQEGAVPEPEP